MADSPRPYRDDLAFVHDVEFGFHADRVAPGVLALLEPVRATGGVVLEIGAGTGALTRHLVAAGHQVIATDASAAMLARGRVNVPGAAQWRLLAVPDDPVPAADAVVAVGHPLNYLPDEAAVRRAFAVLAGALRPGGVLAVDVCDLSWGDATTREPRETRARLGADWALFTRFSLPEPTRYVREITTFVRADGDVWRRADERHENVLVDTAGLAGWLADHGVEAGTFPGFGTEVLPAGLVAVIGRVSGAAGAGAGPGPGGPPAPWGPSGLGGSPDHG